MQGLLVIALSSYTLGEIVLRMLGIRFSSGLDSFLHSLGTGLGAWCCLLFLIGISFLMQPWILVTLSILLALPAPYLLYRTFSTAALFQRVKKVSPLDFLLISVILAILACTFIAALLPVTGGIRNDEVCAHLYVPQQWLLAGGLADLRFSVSYIVGNAHLLFTLASCFSAESGPHLISWLSFVLLLIGVYQITRQFSDMRTALIAVTIVAINPLIFRGASIAFVDLESTLFIVLPLTALQHYVKEKRLVLLMLCGFYLGIGCGIKPTNFVYTGVTVLMAGSWFLIRRIPVRPTIAGFVTLCTVLLIFGSFWPARNMILSGCPVFPPPLALLSKGDLKPLNGKPAPYTYNDIKGFYDYCLSRYGDYHRTPINYLRLPWDVTMDPEQFQIGDSIGTVTLSFLPVILFTLPLSAGLVGLLIFAALNSLLLYFGVLPEARYYMGVLIALSPLLAITISKLADKKGIRVAVVAVFLVNLLFCLAVAVRLTIAPLTCLLKPRVMESYRHNNIPYCEVFDYIRTHRIKEVSICFTNQIFYYSSARCIVDPEAMKKPARTSDSSYLLDIDYSQTLERNLAHLTGNYCYSPPSRNARLVFEGPDARLYQRTSTALQPKGE